LNQLLAFPVAHARATAPDFAPLIASIGDRAFDARLVEFLNKTCGAEHTFVFFQSADAMVGVATASIDGCSKNYRLMSFYVKQGLWKRDPSYAEAQAKLCGRDRVTVRTDISHLDDDTLRNRIYARRNIRDRVLICARNGAGVLGLTLCSSDSSLSAPNNIEILEHISPTLVALLAKHMDASRKADVSVALTTLDEIETCISCQLPTMPRREAEVCSRVIYGVSSLGIALELGISQETVMTYRKRAYGRLGIATQRELFLWYLRVWSAWSGRPSLSARQMHADPRNEFGRPFLFTNPVHEQMSRRSRLRPQKPTFHLFSNVTRADHP